MRNIYILGWLLFMIGCSVEREIPKDHNVSKPSDQNTSSSVTYHYLDHYIKNEKLIEAINSDQGVCIVSTINLDMSSNAAIFNIEMISTKYMIITFKNDNQTLNNLKNRPQGIVTFLQYSPQEKEAFEYVGAKLLFTYLSWDDDVTVFESVYERILQPNEHLLMIIEIRPLG